MNDSIARPAPSWRAWAGTIRSLSWAERVLVAEAALLITLAPAALRLLGMRRLTRALARGRGEAAPPRAAGAGDSAELPHVARLVGMSARHTPFANTCLHRSLVLWWLLGRHGHAADLVIGARKADGELAAHAWVECHGAVVNDDPEAVRHYVVLDRTRA